MEKDEVGADPVRTQVMALLRGGQAHVKIEDAVGEFPVSLRGVVPERLPYSAWQLLEHMRITQRDILNFCAPPTGGYQPLEWPKSYWPETAEPPYAGSWDNTLAEIGSDLRAFEELVMNAGNDLYKPFRWGQGQNLLREALLIADHTAYHLGEMVVLRRILGIWRS